MHLTTYRHLRDGGVDPEALAARIRADAVEVAGGLDDMAPRAAAYYELYLASGRSFAFALIAAHGALWARWYLKLADIAARLLAVIDPVSRLTRTERIAAYDRFVDRFRDINRHVMIETWVTLHLTMVDPDNAALGKLPRDLRDAIAECHASASSGVRVPDDRLRKVYEQYFRWEQVVVVGPLVQIAIDEFQWELAKWFCRRPWVWFSYFRIGRALVFRDFTDAEERTQKELAAFDWAARKGWHKIESNLLANPLFPRGLFDSAKVSLAHGRERMLSGALPKGADVVRPASPTPKQ